VILGILGVFCIIYYILCGVYAGFGASFLGIWPLAGIVLLVLCLAGSLHRKGKLPFHLPVGIKIAVGVLVLLGLLLFACMEGLIASRMFAKGEKDLDYLLVLGAQVRGDVVSQALEDRLVAARDYLEENPETKAVLSGGQGTGENISEAQAMYDWLTAQGIDKERLIMEARSTSTWENMTFSKALLPEDAGEIRVGIVTNNFHVYRGVKLAKACGFTKAQGIAGESHSLLQLHFLVREAFALAKDMIKYKLYCV
jgi:uncharacterized SAM-binding protein YcdF (DUF218 family)